VQKPHVIARGFPSESPRICVVLLSKKGSRNIQSGFAVSCSIFYIPYPAENRSESAQKTGDDLILPFIKDF